MSRRYWPAGQGGERSRRSSTTTGTSSPLPAPSCISCSGEPDYAAARRTTINAHYTDAALAKVVWDAVTALGFDGGQVLEPGCGSGNFIGLAPPGAQVLGVELDPVTAAVAARLYPDAEIRCESFAGTRLPEGHFDLVIGNVPFSSARLHDRRHNAAGHSMHNHFIIKSLTFLKPGGLLAVLTSRYTMDAQDPSAREEMAGLASLVTAVRLPSGAHRRAAGTEAVTDLLVLRRTDPGAPGPQPQWRRAFETSLDGGTAWINEYWRDHPENVLGSFTVGRGQYNDHDLTVRPSGDLSGVASQLAVRLAARPVTVAPQEVPAGETDRFDGTLRANDDGSFSVLRDGLWQSWPCPATQAGELRDLLGLRDTVAALLDAEASSPEDTPAITGLRAELNRRYDAYAAAYGPVNRTGWKRTGKTDEEGNDVLARHRPPQGKFSEDPYAAAVYALEDFDPETGQAAKTVIFTKRVITTRQPPERASDPADAVAICMDLAGEVRLEDAGRLLGSASAGEARTALGELVYDEPGTGRLVPAAEYLSGKVRAKLRDAEQAAGDDPRFEVNVAALRRALPPDLGPGEIDARLGASWIEPRYVQQGLREILEDPALKVEKGHGTAWTVTGSKTSVLATQVWGTEEKDAVSLAACLLEQRPVKVSPERSDRDETAQDKHQKRLQAAAATVTARAKADELNRRFGEWLWEHPERTADLVRTYNERFNSLVLRSYDGARPALPGLASWFRDWVHPHQLAAVARIVNEPAVLLAHDVGAGKTAEMAMGAMELRRLGLAAKPAIVVPNHMLEQFQREFLQLYPQARVLAAGNDDLKALGRHTFTARIATGNWDAVIMSQSVFERIPMSAPEIERYIGAQLAGYDAWLERAREAQQSKRMIKKMETRKLMREQRLRKKLDRARDGGICWEQTGIDYLFIDEAHAYKNLDIRSNNQELDIDGSGRASDLEMKLDYLRAAHGRRVVTFATATPIANSMTEAYVMCRYLRPDLLADAGIEDFDAWTGTFAETTTDVEVAPEGGIRVKDRFARFRNIPELLNMWRVAADVKTKEDLKLPIPELAGGKPEVVPVEPSGQLLDFMQNLAKRAEAVRSHAVLPDEDNMLKISSDGRLAALDPRLAGLAAPETGKLDVAAQNIARIEHEHRDDTYYDAGGNLLPVTGSLQIVFCDLGTPGGKSRWNAYEYLRGKLAEYGIDPRTVRFMHEAKTDKAKAELFAAARAGKVAVLIGSTSLMGVGTNVQDIAIALHHLDCPWRPADVAQREGRILRQRNKHPEVHIYRYVTERSFDAYMWQTVTRKAKFIDQVIHGKTTGRDAEDIGGDMAALSYSEVTALATGDMRILVKAKADSEVQRLERLESAWRRTRQHLKTKISDSAQSAARLTDVAAQLGSALERRADTRGDAFTMRLDGQAFSKRTDAAACLRSMLHTQISQAKKGTRPRDDHQDIGTLGGFTIICTPTWGSGNQVWAHLRFDGVPVPAVRISETELGLVPGKPPVGLITRLENKLADLGTDRDKVLQEISRIQAETERARTAVSAPFAHADELSRARAQSDRLADELRGEPSAPPPAPAAAQTPDAGEAAPDPAAHTAAAGSDPGQHASAASPPADGPGTRTGSTSPATRTSPAPGPGTQPAAEEAGPAQRAPSTALSAPAGPAEAAAPARQPAAASPPVPAPAPAGTSSRADQAAVPQAAPAPSAHDPSQPADQDQPAAGDPAGGLVIEHHQQGTLVHGTQKNDHQLRRLLHDHGFRWSGNLNAWYLPRPWTFSTRARRVGTLTADLRQAHRSFTMRTQPPAPGGTDDSPPEPLPAADPYTDIRQARSDHSRAISDYWALTRTPAGNSVMSAYPESGARPDALALNAAYKAVRVSWEEAFAGDPQEVAGRFTAWVQAASALSRNLAAEQHRAPVFRQTLDTFTGSATRLASRTQATAEDPAAWARVFASLPAAAPDAGPTPETGIPDPAQPAVSSPDHDVSPAEDEQARQHSRENEHPASPAGAVPGSSTDTETALPAVCRNAADLRQLAAACLLSTGTGPAGARGTQLTVVHDHGRTVLLHDDVSGTSAGGYRLDPGDVPAYLAAYLRHPQLPPRCLAGLARQDPAAPGGLTLAGARETAARHNLEVRVRRVAGQSYITFCEPGITGLPVLSYPAGTGSALHGPSTVPVAAIDSYLFTYRRSIPAAMFTAPAAAPPDWARRVTQLTPHLIDEGGYFIRAARDHLHTALAAARDGNTGEAARLLAQAEAATLPLTPSPEREAELIAFITQHTARYGYTDDPAGYMARAVPPLLDASDREWDWARSYISAHPEVREHPAQDEAAAQAGQPDDGRQQAAGKSRQAKAALDSGDFEQALALLDEAELLYPEHGISYGAARDQVRSATDQAGPGHPQDQHSPATAAAPAVTAWPGTAAGPGAAGQRPDAESASGEADAGQQQRGAGTGGRPARQTVSPAPGEHAPDEHHAAGPPGGTQPLAAHTGWAGNLRPERLLYADGTPLTIRGQGDDNDQVLPATAAGAVPAPGDSEYGSGRLQVVRWADGQHAIIHPALASPAGIDAYAGLSDRDRARWEAFDLAEAWPATTAGLPPHLVDAGDVLQVERGPRSRTMDLREVQSVRPGTGTLAGGLEFKVTGIRSRLFYPPNRRVPVCIPEEHPSLPAAIQAALAAAPDSPETADPAPDLSPGARAADDTATRDTARATPQPAPAASAPPAGSQPGTAPRAAATAETGTPPAPGEPAGSGEPEPGASPLTNSDLAAELRHLPGFARWLSQAGTPPAEGDLDSQRPGAGPSAASDARGIEITVSGPGFTRHGLVTWPQAASWIDAGVTPARLGIVIIADRLSAFCRTHRDQLIAAGTCDPDATAAELGQIRDNAIATVVDAALRSRGAAAPVPPAGPGDPAWYTAVMITRPDRAAGKAENAALERLTRLRTTIREPQPATAAEIRATIRRWTGYALPDLVRALDDPAAMRAWISDQASHPGEGGYDSSGERWYGASPDGLITDRSGDDRAATLIRWEEIPAWIQPGITSSLRDRLLAAADASSAVFRRRLTAAVHPDAGLTAPSEEEDKQAVQRRTEAVDAAWAAIEAAPPPSPAELDHARHVYRDTSPVQQTLFDDPPQDSTPTQDGTRATASRPPRPAPSGPAVPAGAGRPAAKAAAPQAEPARQQDPPGHRAAGPQHSPAAGPAAPAGEHHPDADRPDPRTSPEEDQPAAPPADAASPRAAGTRRQNPGTAAGPAHAGPAHDDDPEPPPTPATNSDLAIALHHMSGQELTSFLTSGKTPAHGSRGWRRKGLPDAGASEDLDFERSGVRITVRSRGFRRHGQISWRQVASWIDTGLTPARLGIIIAASRLHIYTYARRDELIAAGKDNIDAAIRELNQISIDAIDAALGAALSARDADAPVPPARPGKPAYSTTAMLTRPDPAASAEENTALARIAELEAAIRGTQPVTPADIKGTIRWWIGDSLPEYARALASPEAMRAWIRRQASGPASRPGKGSYDSTLGRYYSASPEGLRTSKGSDTRTPPFILWEEIPAWIQPGLSASLRDRLAAAEPRQAPGRKRTSAARPPAGTADLAGQADDPLPRPLREAIDAAWAAIEAAPPPAPADLDHARTTYRGTGTAQQPLPAGPAETGQTSTPAPRPRAEPRPAPPSRHPGPAAHRQDELPGAIAASAPAGPPPRHGTPARAAASTRAPA